MVSVLFPQQFASNIFGILQSIKAREEGTTRKEVDPATIQVQSTPTVVSVVLCSSRGSRSI